MRWMKSACLLSDFLYLCNIYFANAPLFVQFRTPASSFHLMQKYPTFGAYNGWLVNANISSQVQLQNMNGYTRIDSKSLNAKRTREKKIQQTNCAYKATFFFCTEKQTLDSVIISLKNIGSPPKKRCDQGLESLSRQEPKISSQIVISKNGKWHSSLACFPPENPKPNTFSLHFVEIIDR